MNVTHGETANLLEYLFFKLILIKILKINPNTKDIYVQLYQSAHYPYTLMQWLYSIENPRVKVLYV